MSTIKRPAADNNLYNPGKNFNNKCGFGEKHLEPIFKEDGSPNGHVSYPQSADEYLRSVEDRRYVEIANIVPLYDGLKTLGSRLTAIMSRCSVFKITVEPDKISAVIASEHIKHFYLLAQGIDCDADGNEVPEGDEGQIKLLPGEN